jgi:hypothetical protein
VRKSPDGVREKLKVKATPMVATETTVRKVVKHAKSISLAQVIVKDTASLSIRETVQNELDTRSLSTSIRQSNQSLRNN